MDAFDILDVGRAHFRQRLVAVLPEQVATPTPCIEWTVRDLMNHVIGGQRRYIMLLCGASTAAVEATRKRDHVRSGAVAAFDSAHAELVEAFRQPGALDTIVHHRGGDRTGHDLMLMRTVEYTVHGWDLSRAIGFDDNIDPTLAEYVCDEVAAARHLWETPRGVFAEPKSVDEQ